MDGIQSGWIRVRKRSGELEPFDVFKLGGTLWRAMQRLGAPRSEATDLAGVIQTYLLRSGCHNVTSAAVFEMSLKVLRRVGALEAAGMLETHRECRRIARARLKVLHEAGQVTDWDKTWLTRLAGGMWNLSSTTARILAGQIELELLVGRRPIVTRQEVMEILNDRVAAWGLADAVPLRESPVGYGTVDPSGLVT